MLSQIMTKDKKAHTCDQTMWTQLGRGGETKGGWGYLCDKGLLISIYHTQKKKKIMEIWQRPVKMSFDDTLVEPQAVFNQV